MSFASSRSASNRAASAKKRARLHRWFAPLLLLCAAGLALLAQAPQTESPASPTRLNNLGVAYMNQQRFEEALELFRQASELDPSLVAPRVNQAIAFLNLQRLDPARDIFSQIVEQQPENARAWFNLGLLHKSAGRSQAGFEAFQRAAALIPEDSDVHYFRGSLLVELERYQEAVAAFKQALTLEPFHASAEFGLARAYRRLGDSERARQHLERFQHLTQQGLGTPISLAYGDQGAYSLAEQVPLPPEAVPAPVSVHFSSIAAEAGLTFHHGPATPPDTDASTLPALLGSGACFFDYNRDGRADVFLANSGEALSGALYRNAGEGRFLDVTREAGLEMHGHGLACAAGDYDNDGWIDLAIGFHRGVELFRNQAGATFASVTNSAGLTGNHFPMGITFVDYDHDGDLDLYVTRLVDVGNLHPGEPFLFPLGISPASNLLWRNNGNGTFTEWTGATGLAGTSPTVAAVATDFNNDRAVDFILTGWRKSPTVLANPREGSFRLLEPWKHDMPSPTAGVAVFDFNKDGWMDVAFTHWGKPGLTLWRNVSGREFELAALPDLSWRRGWGLAAVDYDNDGWIDLAAVGETEDGGEIRILRNRGPEGFQDTTSGLGLSDLKLTRPRALITADYDSDGDSDLLITQNSGPVVLLRNDGGNQNVWLRLALSGLADNRSAIGTKVEVFAGTGWQKWEVPSGSGYLGQSALEIVAGLGREQQADIVRLLWPTGILQDEVQLAADSRHELNEIDRRGSSCPILFVWNGERYQFVSDIIGAAIAGHWVGPGQRNIPDTDEYVKVEGARVQLRNGRLSFRFMEPMEELVYLDQVRLLAVDHPAEVDIEPNEYFASQPPFPAFKVITSRDARPPLGAWDHAGRDVLEKLRTRDRHYVDDFALLNFAGFAELHELILELPDQQPTQPLRLLLHGFTDYFSATSMYAAHQAGISPIAPYVEAQTPEGAWVRVSDDIGFPAGLRRTMVADLSGRLPAGAKRIRIVTNLQIYWDQILIDTTVADPRLRITEIPLAEATLSFRGYPRVVEGNPRNDLTYLYEEVSATGPYATFRGAHTPYGDVLSLTQKVDDTFAIFGTGEEIALEFDPTALEPPPPGWTRDYLFYAEGFVKDMDFYEAHALTVGPLPFHGMTGYPYPPDESYPAEEPHLRYRLELNTRPVSGNEGALYRFDYKNSTDPQD